MKNTRRLRTSKHDKRCVAIEPRIFICLFFKNTHTASKKERENTSRVSNLFGLLQAYETGWTDYLCSEEDFTSYIAITGR